MSCDGRANMPKADQREVERLIEIFEASDMQTLHVRRPELEVFLSRHAGDEGAPVTPSPLTPATEPAPQATAAAPEGPPSEPAADSAGAHVVRAPMVGTVYGSPEPGMAPFVQTGQRVDASATVCLIEAMKLYTAVAAEVDGVVEEILFSNGESVEYGQPLLRIVPDAGADGEDKATDGA
ncbi:MAG TPA: acetyl-CoA carboxylase biotin carboxyl carrier protein [Solirubrobacter sp.]|nr:acetyl-CoA carboxylase biotin carboxyl carrier protein [Solirubrobacter sp.]